MTAHWMCAPSTWLACICHLVATGAVMTSECTEKGDSHIVPVSFNSTVKFNSIWTSGSFHFRSVLLCRISKQMLTLFFFFKILECCTYGAFFPSQSWSFIRGWSPLNLNIDKFSHNSIWKKKCLRWEKLSIWEEVSVCSILVFHKCVCVYVGVYVGVGVCICVCMCVCACVCVCVCV